MPARGAVPAEAERSVQMDVAKKVHEVVSVLEAHGWRQSRERGSHRQFRHPDMPRVVTVAGKRSDTMPVGQLASIRRNSGIKELR